MNRSLGAALLGLALLPTAVFAQSTSTAPTVDSGRPQLSDAQRAQLRSTMQQSFQQMRQLHTQFRTALLGSLSPTHRAALASIVGQLAVSPNPDYRGAAQQIDALLSSGERQNILSAASAYHTQSRALRDQQRQAFLSVLTPDQQAAMQARQAQFQANGEHRNAQAASQRVPDAGMLLLMSSVPGAGRGFGFGEMHGRGGPDSGPV